MFGHEDWNIEGDSAMWMLTGANGYTMARRGETFSGAVIDGEKIVAVGDSKMLRLQFGSQLDKVLDVEGATVLPGFVDSHVHISWLGMQMDTLNLHDARSQEDVLCRIREKASTLKDGQWLIGANWDENQFAGAGPEAKMPSIDALDDAAGGRPVLLRRICGHVVLANQLAFERAGLGTHPANPAGGHFGRDTSGNLDGYAYEGATHLIEKGLPKATMEQMESFVGRAMSVALAAGITSVHTEDVRFIDGLWKTMRVYQNLQNRGLRLRVHQLVGYDYLDEYAQYLSTLDSNVLDTQASTWLEAGAVKLFSDGSLGGRTAFLLNPYTDHPSTRGTAIYSQEELNHHVAEVRKHGLSVAIHAIGDGGVDRVLTALESVDRVKSGESRTSRDRLIHAELVNEALLHRISELGDTLIIDAQPRFAASDLPWAVEQTGCRTPSIPMCVALDA